MHSILPFQRNSSMFLIIVTQFAKEWDVKFLCKFVITWTFRLGPVVIMGTLEQYDAACEEFVNNQQHPGLYVKKRLGFKQGLWFGQGNAAVLSQVKIWYDEQKE